MKMQAQLNIAQLTVSLTYISRPNNSSKQNHDKVHQAHSASGTRPHRIKLHKSMFITLHRHPNAAQVAATSA